jgi:hypothetical protein
MSTWTADTWIQFFIAISCWTGIVWGSARWWYKRMLRGVATQVAEILKEVRPNGGGSMNDRVTRIEEMQCQQMKILSELRHPRQTNQTNQTNRRPPL